jgi:hypothetical protein
MHKTLSLLLNCHPHLPAEHTLCTNEVLITEYQWYNCNIQNRGNAVLEACIEALKVKTLLLDLCPICALKLKRKCQTDVNDDDPCMPNTNVKKLKRKNIIKYAAWTI